MIFVADGGLIKKNKYVVEIHKPNYKKEKIQATKIGINELSEANKSFKGKSSLQLYLYLCANKDKDKFALKAKDVCDFTGMSDKSFYNARDELIDKGYIVDIGDDVHRFYTMPVSE